MSGAMDDTEGACIFTATYEALANLLRLPRGVRIVGTCDEGWSRSIEIMVRGPGLPACDVGMIPARARTVVTQQGDAIVETRLLPIEDEVVTLRAEVARLRKLVVDDGR